MNKLSEKVLKLQEEILSETKEVKEIVKKLTPNKKIRRDIFLKELLDDKFLVKCRGKYTDDYYYDSITNTHDEDFSNALGYFEYTQKDKVNYEQLNWYIKASCIYWDSDNSEIINVIFAQCQYWEFKYKKVL